MSKRNESVFPEEAVEAALPLAALSLEGAPPFGRFRAFIEFINLRVWGLSGVNNNAYVILAT